MRAIITASGIQDYIFDITQKAASARLRGRSARLGLILDLCQQRISQQIQRENFRVLRSAGSRLDIEFKPGIERLNDLIAELQVALDRYSREHLDGQVWFSCALAKSDEIDKKLFERNLSPGKSSLQRQEQWDETSFIISRQTDERKLQREDRSVASDLPEAILGRRLAHRENKFLQFTETQSNTPIRILDYFVTITEDEPSDGYCFALEEHFNQRNPQVITKRVCRYAPVDKHRNLLDLGEIAELSQGAAFLGVLKMDLDNAAAAFTSCKTDTDRQELSDHLDEFFTTGVAQMLESSYKGCYVVYSGGDDLFLLGPWNQTICFALDFRTKLQQSAARWGAPQLSISAGIKLSHRGSAVRHLASEADAALYLAKRQEGKNSIAVFERTLQWDEVDAGISWANQFVDAASPHRTAAKAEKTEDRQLSIGFLQRMQYYASQAQEYFERRQLQGLCAIPLFHNDWSRNKDRIGEELRKVLEKEVVPALTGIRDDSAKKWRIMDFASRYASYAVRETKGEEHK